MSVSDSISVPVTSTVPNPAVPSTSLYIGNLSPETTEAQVFEFVKSVAHPTSVHIARPRDEKNPKSVHGYIAFLSPDDAARVVRELSYNFLNNRAVRITIADKSKALQAYNILVKNLPPSLTPRDTYDAFSNYGTIVSLNVNGQVKPDGSFENNGYGFFAFETEEEAATAVREINGHQFGEYTLIAEFYDENKKGPKNNNNLYVKHLLPSHNEETLRALFSKYGNITSLSLNEKGFAFVCFLTADEAAKAVEALHNTPLKDLATTEEDKKFLESDKVTSVTDKFYVGFHKAKKEHEQETKAYKESLRKDKQKEMLDKNITIRNLPKGTTDEALKEHFSQFGTIASTRISVKEDNGNTTTTGYVCFATPEEATNALKEKNHKIDGKSVTAHLWVPADQRTQRPPMMNPGRRHTQQKMPYPADMMRLIQQMTSNLQGMYGNGAIPPNFGRGMAHGKKVNNMMQRGPAMRNNNPMSFPMVPNAMMPQVRPQHIPFQQHHQQPQPQQDASITYLKTIETLPEAEARDKIGEFIYYFIHKDHPEQASKLTGMLLQAFSVPELKHALSDTRILQSHIKEAFEALQTK